ncbi:MAG: hypothetical protein CMG00_08805 [Candidatus Marinimicrobia bacterium]|nr:hypothetical protein [Candidatus Neomarinimicrobiota bacterium]
MLFLFLVLTSCESSNSLIMDRGSYFYKNENYNEAANQFNKVILSYPQNINLLRSKDIEILAHAYQQLALCQSKLAILSNDMTNKKIYFNEAIENIKKAERLVIKPQKREEYRKTHLGIKFQLESL